MSSEKKLEFHLSGKIRFKKSKSFSESEDGEIVAKSP